MFEMWWEWNGRVGGGIGSVRGGGDSNHVCLGMQEECQRLRQSIKCGFIKALTVVSVGAGTLMMLPARACHPYGVGGWIDV
jgi:hypothetical protein